MYGGFALLDHSLLCDSSDSLIVILLQITDKMSYKSS